MIRHIFSVGGWTLLSRLTGFIRDIVMAAVLGAGPVADAFLIAFRLPNHFRAIFAEGAFNAAFVPSYTRVMTQEGPERARLFANGILTAVVVVQLVLLGFALAGTAQVVSLLAPGLAEDPERFALAVTLTQITFPYLGLIALVTLYGGVLNANERFWAAAAASILLNVAMVGTLSVAGWFPTAGHAAAWGVLISGFLQLFLLMGDAGTHGLALRPGRPRLDPDTRRFLKALGPAVLGSAGVQLALFADTLIASFLPQGALAALYYADRINQLPIGVVGIAVGVVLLPQMSRQLAAGDENGARHSQARAIEFTLLLTLPFMAIALTIPDLLMRALFARGAFTAEDAHAAGMTLAAYAVGLIPFVVMRAFIAPFHARSDTTTPVIATLCGAGVNIALKILLMDRLAQVGLALGTATGGWVSLLLLMWFARRQGFMAGDATLRHAAPRLIGAALVLAGVLAGAVYLLAPVVEHLPAFRDETRLFLALMAGGLVYLVLVWRLVGTARLRSLFGRKKAGVAE
ncbi:murein biosynthesis integral membrane protein MurJ [Ancylobacter terrae]|uniref:murein biosynthesis integral membrane protein MurJ n=1 Tax=Ancylobacter sp. sgz301288 TaxID=3342077 RepID=UPI0038585545